MPKTLPTRPYTVTIFAKDGAVLKTAKQTATSETEAAALALGKASARALAKFGHVTAGALGETPQAFNAAPDGRRKDGWRVTPVVIG